MRQVAITGLGVVSPVGSGRETFWSNLVAGRGGIGRITLFDVSTFPVRIGGQVRDVDIPDLARRHPALCGERDRKVVLGMAAVDEAIADADLPPGVYDNARLFVGVGLESFHLGDITAVAHEPDMGKALLSAVAASSGSMSIQTPLDRLADLAGECYGLNGGRITNCSACAAGAQSIGEAFWAVREGICTVAVAGAADSMLNPLGLGGFSLLRVLSAENDQPQRACRPFDATRQGTVVGEGAAFLVLEEWEAARRRGARVYATIQGYGSSLDAYRLSDPEPDGVGATTAMRSAIADAGLSPADIDCVNAHGTGTPKNDMVETAALKQVLGLRARQIPVHAVKSMTGHMIAASGAAEAVTAAMSLCRGVVPPTANLRTPDRECDLDYVPGAARPFAGRTVLSNSFGFGGQNATLIFGRV